jgi:hypothetical protein
MKIVQIVFKGAVEVHVVQGQQSGAVLFFQDDEKFLVLEQCLFPGFGAHVL